MQNFIIMKTQSFDIKRVHKIIPVFIIFFSFFVDITVNLNCEQLFMAIEIQYISIYWMLVSEFVSG